MRAEKCGRCYYFELLHAEKPGPEGPSFFQQYAELNDEGLCRRYPPSSAAGGLEFSLPEVWGGDDWCGEFKLKRTVKGKQ